MATCVEVLENVYGNGSSAKIAILDSGTVAKEKTLKFFGKYDEHKDECKGKPVKRVMAGIHKAFLNRGEGIAVAQYWLAQLAQATA